MFSEWQYYVMRGIGRVIRHLSYPTVISLGRRLGPLVSRIMKKAIQQGHLSGRAGAGMQ